MQQSPEQLARPLVEAIIEGLQDVKAKDIKVLDLRSIEHAVTEFFVIAHGTSRTQVDGLAQSVEKTVRETLNERPWGKQGLRNGEWAILDYSNVVVHIFHESVRPRYALEELWGDAEFETIEELA
jgi:ribosome-associated protein